MNERTRKRNRKAMIRREKRWLKLTKEMQMEAAIRFWLKQVYWMTSFLLGWFSTLKMEEIFSSETSVRVRTKRLYIPECGSTYSSAAIAPNPARLFKFNCTFLCYSLGIGPLGHKFTGPMLNKNVATLTGHAAWGQGLFDNDMWIMSILFAFGVANEQVTLQWLTPGCR
jgi:hypothetical protein